MPRIDPLQLLKCLSVLLTPEGGILSRDEVPRLVSLMTKFSKKLVSKCVYVLILANTDVSLLELFMAEGGWTLIQTWLEDAMKTCNDDLVIEILSLLLITPVDIERLKSNTIPRLVKTLTKRDGNGSVKELSTLLVQKWLAIVKSTTQEMAAQKAHAAEQSEHHTEPMDVAEEVTINDQQAIEEPEMTPEETNIDQDDDKDAVATGTFYKLTVRGGKQVIRRLPSSENEADSDELDIGNTTRENATENEESDKDSEKKKSKPDKDKTKSRSSSKSKSSSHRDKDKHRSSGSSKSSSSREKSSSSRDKEKDRDREKDKKDREKDKHRYNGIVKHSSSKDKERRDSKDKDKKDRKEKDSKDKHSDKDVKDAKDKQAERDKDTLAKIKPQSLDKIGRIPKKATNDKPKESDKDKPKDGEKAKEKENDKPKDNKEPKRKGTMSIEVRKNTEERPKTVKIFNSKMRSTGLEEEIKPPPPRNAMKKPQPSTILPTIPMKRPSPPRDIPIIPEKKIKLELVDRPIPERPGAIKLIPPKPKPVVLQESDIFMDALTASATAKKEPKKRKRRLSLSKEATPTSPTSPTASPTKEEHAGATSPPNFKNIAPPNFYQDTLETVENNVEIKEVKDESPQSPDMKTEDKHEIKIEDLKEEKIIPTETLNVSVSTDIECDIEPKKQKTDGLKGVLVYIKKKGPKRSVKWKADEDLVEIRHFELDETERVNVTKTFMDMAKMDISSEREALQLSRKVPNEDLMEQQTSWRFPYLIDQPEPKVQPGSGSLEKDIQFAREKNVLQALYFHKRLIPDNPAEPMPETHQMSDPVIIPLDDPECQEIDLRNTPWPEPKAAPPIESPVNASPMFRNIPPQQAFQTFPPMNPAGFQGMPRFQAPPGPAQIPEGPQMMEAPAFLGPQGGFGHPNMMNPNLMGHQNMGPPEMMGQGPPMDPGMFGPGVPGGPGAHMGPPGGPMQAHDGFNPMMNDGGNFQGGFNQQNMEFGMYHHQNNGGNNNNYEMNRPPVGNDRNERDRDRDEGMGGRGRGRGRGFHHRRGGGGWVRLNNNGPSHHGGGNWRGGGGGPRPNTNRVCKNVKNHGYCRNIDNCPFIHPN